MRLSGVIFTFTVTSTQTGIKNLPLQKFINSCSCINDTSDIYKIEIPNINQSNLVNHIVKLHSYATLSITLQICKVILQCKCKP